MRQVLGFDPGGNDQFGWCVCSLRADGALQLTQSGKVSDAESAFEAISVHINPNEAPAACGIDAPMFWVAKGGRVADELVRKAISHAGAPSASGTVQHFNSLRGACVIQGMIIARLLRDRFPQMPIVETHPKALLWLLGFAETPALNHVDQLRDLCKVPVPLESSNFSEHERDAALGAYAASKLFLQDATWIDLLPREHRPICAVDQPLSYVMPQSVLLQEQGGADMRVVEPGPARGSLRWIRRAVNERSELLNSEILRCGRIPRGTEIEWVSPLRSDDYAEYRDQQFLELLNVKLDRVSLHEFWPRRGPQWDALARTSSGDVLLVEAKANIPEMVSSGCAASAKSRQLIELSLAATKEFLGVNSEIPWTGRLYQYANRLAHLYLLRELNGIRAWLSFIYFLGDPDTNGPSATEEWKAALTVAKTVLGLSRNKLDKYVIEVFIDTEQL